jgi:prevent-host-death family protein
MDLITLEAARESLDDLVAQAAAGGEPVIITRDGAMAAVLSGLAAAPEPAEDDPGPMATISFRVPKAVVDDEAAFGKWIREDLIRKLEEGRERLLEQ